MLKYLCYTISSIISVLLSSYNEETAADGLRQCTKAVRNVKLQLKTAKSVGEKQSLLSTLAQIKSFRNQIKQTQKRGSGTSTTKETAKHRVHWDDTETAFDSRIRTGVISNLKHKDPREFLKDCFALFKRRIQNALKKEEAVKVNAIFCGKFVIIKADRIIEEFKYCNTKNTPIYRDTNLEEWFQENIQLPILTQLEQFLEKDSGWALQAISNLGININKFTPQIGSSYIELPKFIKKKEACINVKNGDEACFAWAVVSALYPANSHSYRTSSYPHYSSVLNLTGIQFPMTRRQIPRFEKQNNISVNVYILKKFKKHFITLPTYLTKEKKDKHVNLLMIQDQYFDDDDDDTISTPVRYHYVWIKNLSRLLSQQLSKMHGQKYFCDRCLHYFYTQSALDKHTEDCIKMNNCKVRLPREDQKQLRFKNFKNKEKAPFIIYADLESILVPMNSNNKYQQHVPAAIGYYIKCSYDDSRSSYHSYRGEDCMSWFARQMNEFAEDVETVFLCPHDMKLTAEQQAEFDEATHCHICEQPFSPDDLKVRDHFHLSPENNYRGAAHNACNINYKDEVIVPVVFHNLSGYDSHFILEKIANDMPGRVDLLPVTKEKYISFTKHIDQNLIKFRFIDSLRFMSSSLDTLSSYLSEFPNLKSQFTELDSEQFDLLTKKGVYPYDFMSSFDKFNLESLPEQQHFYNKLENKDISDAQYEHAQRVWSVFNIKDLGQYTDLYMRTDILLLADVFEQFRSSCHLSYGLDPANYYTLPGYTWDCMLKHTGCSLELLTDIDMVMFVERGIRGGLSQCSKRKSVANNKYLQNFDPAKPTKYLSYFDINNQYGWAMSQSLPFGGFEWTDTNIDITGIPDNSDVGYILEVDLQYPESLHDLHRDLPFCPEHSAAPGCKETKLLATLHNKTKYVIHYRALKQALKNGLKLTQIHRALKFKQSPWLKSYIDLNTKFRQQAKNEFEKNLFKLMNNAVFGKTMENIRKHSIVKLVNKWEGRYGAEALIAKPEFKSTVIFNENLVAIELNKTEIYFCKPLYIGMAILDIAKTTIYDFHYDYMIPEFSDDCSVLYTDTDSLIYEIIDKDIYEIMRRDCHSRFDTSDYPLENRYNIPHVNKKVLGMMKDEFNGVPIEIFVGLRAKMYTIKRVGDDTTTDVDITKKIKGIKKSVIKNAITLEDFIECVDNFKDKHITQNLIRSEKHVVYSVAQEKIALSPYDDKRHLINGSYETLPWGHYSIMNDEPTAT